MWDRIFPNIKITIAISVFRHKRNEFLVDMHEKWGLAIEKFRRRRVRFTANFVDIGLLAFINTWLRVIVQFIEAVVQRCSVKNVFLEISQNSQENTCARVSFFNNFNDIVGIFIVNSEQILHDIWCFHYWLGISEYQLG